MEIPQLWAIPEAYCPPLDYFQSGMAVFQEKFGETFDHKAIGQADL
jgi:hypothetical protein